MKILRTLAAILVGNALGLLAWTLARAALPWLWRERGAMTDLLLLMGLVAVTAILFAAPPVLAGALGALARRPRPAGRWASSAACGHWPCSKASPRACPSPPASGTPPPCWCCSRACWAGG